MKHVHKGACFCGAIEIEVTGMIDSSARGAAAIS